MSQRAGKVEGLLTPDEVCSLLSVRKQWLYAEVQRGRFPVVRLNGRSLRFKARDVQDYIERRYSQAG